jgi:hypothetical protein
MHAASKDPLFLKPTPPMSLTPPPSPAPPIVKHKVNYIISPKIFIMKGVLTLTPLTPRRTTTGHNLKYYIYRRRNSSTVALYLVSLLIKKT